MVREDHYSPVVHVGKIKGGVGQSQAIRDIEPVMPVGDIDMFFVDQRDQALYRPVARDPVEPCLDVLFVGKIKDELTRGLNDGLMDLSVLVLIEAKNKTGICLEGPDELLAVRLCFFPCCSWVRMRFLSSL